MEERTEQQQHGPASAAAEQPKAKQHGLTAGIFGIYCSKKMDTVKKIGNCLYTPDEKTIRRHLAGCNCYPGTVPPNAMAVERELISSQNAIHSAIKRNPQIAADKISQIFPNDSTSMDALARAATVKLETENMDLNNHVAQRYQRDLTLCDIQRAKTMKKNQNFFYLLSVLKEMAGSLNKRLAREPSVDRTLVHWTDVVGDQRRKQTDGESKKIPVIDLLSDTTIAQSMSIAQKRSFALKIQKWIKNFRFKNTRNELFSWQQSLLFDLTEAYGVQIF